MVYVDSMRPYGKKGWFCHMWADDIKELHTMAIAIGRKRCWFHKHHRLSHYDLREEHRRTAIMFGAIPTMNPYKQIGKPWSRVV